MEKITFIGVKGGPGSGNWGHAGRPGLRGGSGGRGVYSPGGVVLSNAEGSASNSMAISHLDSNMPRSWFIATHAQRAEAKRGICAYLSTKTGVDKEDVRSFIGQWSRSSNDTDMRSLAIQRDAAKEFGVKLSDWQEGKIVENESLAKRATFDPSLPSSFKPLLPSNQQQSLLRAMYTNTQEALREQGIKGHVRLYRGINMPDVATKGWKPRDIVDYNGNTIESWSASRQTAGTFGNVVVSMDVPVENIVGTARTGFGCLLEAEFTIMGSIPGQQAQVIFTE